MKRLTVIDTKDRIIFMPDSFEVHFFDLGDMLFVEFRKTNEERSIFNIPLYFDDEEICADINRFKESEQKRIMKLLKSHIMEDINKFLADEPDEFYYEIFPLNNHESFDTNEFCQRWYNFYDLIIDNPELYQKQKNKKRRKKRNKKHNRK